MKTKRDILNLIDEEDVEFIRLQFADIYGGLKNIAVTLGQIEKVLEGKFSIEGEALFDGVYDPEENFYLYPDLDSFVILPWRPQQGKVGKFICDVHCADGSLYDFSPRTILKKVLEQAGKEGYTFNVDPECEFYLFHTDENGVPTTVTHEKAGYLDVGPLDLGENARRDMVLTLEEMGFDVESSHHEKGAGQHEISFTQGEALETADSLMTFKFAIRSIAKRFGLYATFMPMPRTDLVGSGMHMYFSLCKDGKNLFNGENSDIAKYFMGGIMEHAAALCAITNPIVNSYKRILCGEDAPKQVNWSTRGEQAMLKLCNLLGETKVELRFPDPSANPYLAIAACIAAGLDGVHRQLDPGAENNKKGKALPGNLKDALHYLEKDALLKETLGEEFAKIYLDVKQLEWNDYMKQVSDWEVETYLAKM